MSSSLSSRCVPRLVRRFPLWITLAIFLVCPASPRLIGGDAEADADSKRDKAWRQLIVGTWTTDDQAKQTMTLREDGTALMIVELRGLKAFLFASRLEFDMVWSIENGQLKKRTTSGRPPHRVKAILKATGDRVAEPILELMPDRLRLLDADGRMKHEWRRGGK